MSSLPGADTPVLSPHIVESFLLERASRISSLSFRTRFFSLIRHSSSVSLHCPVDSCYWLQCAEYFAVQEIAMPKFTMVVRIGFYLISSFGLSAVSTRTTTIPESSVAPVSCTFRGYQLLGFRLHTTAFGLQAGGKAGAASCWRYHSGLLGGCMLVRDPIIAVPLCFHDCGFQRVCFARGSSFPLLRTILHFQMCRKTA